MRIIDWSSDVCSSDLERFPTRDRAVHILLIPQPLFPDRGDVGGVGGDQLVERLPLPIFVIGGVLARPLPKGQLVVARFLRPRARRADLAEIVILVIPTRRRRLARPLVTGLAAAPADIGKEIGRASCRDRVCTYV